jgi:predicted secreted Zn-dependent protease
VRTLLLSLSFLLPIPGAAFALASTSTTHTRPGLTLSTRNVYYRITGRTADDLRAQMSRRGPTDYFTGKRYDAFTNWTFSWWYHDRVSAGECRFTSTEVELDLKYTYPRWRRPPGVSTSLVASWNRYLKALRNHESGHGVIAIGVARKLLADIRALAPRPSCRKLEAAADVLGAGAIERANKVEAAYDTRTDHGATQGARFP